MQNDPFYALHELFSFSASSELQYLNLIDEKLGPEMGWAILAEETPSLSNLLYNREMLQTHIRQLKENIEIIKCRGSNHWPHALIDSDMSRKADDAANLLLRDFEFLLAKAENLSKRCDAGMTVVMNNANLAESKRAMAQASRVSKLTLLAFFYVPLSFTASFFGMNFSQFGTSSTLGIWLWFALSAPVLVLSFIFYQWDIAGFIGRSRIYYKVKQWCRRIW
jgi:Mg2+ and Co2+ transporter CorA